MAKHKLSDPRTKELLDQMDDTREAIRAVIEALDAHDVARSEVAASAGWNAGYLSEVLNNPEKRPTAEKVEPLIRSLVMFNREKRVPLGAAEALRRVAERYRIPIEPLATPVDGPIVSTADNYVRRADFDDAITMRLKEPGYYSIDGTPMAGVSTALSHVGRLVQERGGRVFRIDAKTDLSEARLERAKARMDGALAAAIAGSTDLLDKEYHVAQEAIRHELEAAGPEAVVLIDNVNHLEDSQQEVLGQVLRGWSTMKAGLERGFSWTTVWLAYTWRFENLGDVRAHSHIFLDYIFTRWFDYKETLALAEVLEPFGRAAGKIRAGDGWAEGAAGAAHGYFSGQPHLTHLYLWERREDGQQARNEMVSQEHPPTGAYEGHLKLLARAVIGLLGKGGAEDLAQSFREERKVDSSARRSLEDLGLVNIVGLPMNRFYATHLPGALDRMLTA